VRDEARRDIGRFVETYVEYDLEARAARDVKGLYQKAFKGEIDNFTGVSDPGEPPLAPEIVVRTDRETSEESIAKVLHALESLSYLTRGSTASSLEGLADSARI
jgi:adenylylsulfate kinase